MPKATRVDDRRTKGGRRHVNGLSFRPESWKDLAQAAYKKQMAPKSVNPLREVKRWGDLKKLASKEKAAPKDGLSKISHQLRKDSPGKA